MPDETQISRRGVVLGAGVAAGALTIAACGGPDVTYSQGSKTTAESTSASPSTAEETTAQAAPNPAESVRADELAKTSDVPDGGAVLVGGVLITQETKGSYRAFNPVCTHRGCAVETAGSMIACPCHGSLFSLDGSVVNGPAMSPLRPIAIKVAGDSIVRA
ncbi:ubiquinol-cytochrome c reductase iron-sulfur subunit [Smaragdicoccus niigatensis]|uniref:QcrA and Rieske domain-containing protein n=1 Tax=Smaragdicoccus niigatensis TaxID=359359 RepID=UPI00037E056F|nr:Rieske (2Fe-2S) protein [Smaragdicoccus niigatensis]